MTSTSSISRSLPLLPAAAPAKAAEPLDFSRIDTVDKALLLPALNPSVLLMVSGGMFPGGHSLQGDLAMSLAGGAQATMTYTMQPMNLYVEGQGSFAGAKATETWGINPYSPSGISIVGKIGDSDEKLQLSWSGGDEHLDGTVGDIEVHGHISQQAGRIVADYELNRPNEPKVNVHRELTVTDDQGTTGEHDHGNVAGQDFKLDGKVDYHKADGLESTLLTETGSGNGVPASMTFNLKNTP